MFTPSGSASFTKRVGYLLGEFPSVSETFIISELMALEKRGLYVDIFALTKTKGVKLQPHVKRFAGRVTYAPTPISLNRLERMAANLCIPYANLTDFWFFKKRYYKHYYLALWLTQCVKAGKITHIHAHFPEPSLVAAITSLMTNITFSFTVHSHLASEQHYSLCKRVGLSKATIAVGEKIRNRVLTMCGPQYHSKITVVRSGLEIALHQYNQNKLKKTVNKDWSKFKIISVGRLVKHKGFDYLLQAMSLLKSACPNILLEIIGDGPERASLERLINRLNLKAVVYMSGTIVHGSVFYGKLMESDLFALPCITDGDNNQDGLPVAILEAMIYGLPVVSTNIASIPEAVSSKTGFLVPEKDVLGLARAIKKFYLLSRKERVNMGMFSQQIIRRKFDINTSAKKLEDIILA